VPYTSLEVAVMITGSNASGSAVTARQWPHYRTGVSQGNPERMPGRRLRRLVSLGLTAGHTLVSAVWYSMSAGVIVLTSASSGPVPIKSGAALFMLRYEYLIMDRKGDNRP
jgi:hypothetical protein